MRIAQNRERYVQSRVTARLTPAGAADAVHSMCAAAATDRSRRGFDRTQSRTLNGCEPGRARPHNTPRAHAYHRCRTRAGDVARRAAWPARARKRQVRDRKPRDGRSRPSMRCRTKLRCSRSLRRSDGAGLAPASAVTERSRPSAASAAFAASCPLDRPGHAACAEHASRQGCSSGNSRERCLRSTLRPHTPVTRLACSIAGKARARLHHRYASTSSSVRRGLESRLPSSNTRRRVQRRHALPAGASVVQAGGKPRRSQASAGCNITSRYAPCPSRLDRRSRTERLRRARN